MQCITFYQIDKYLTSSYLNEMHQGIHGLWPEPFAMSVQFYDQYIWLISLLTSDLKSTTRTLWFSSYTFFSSSIFCEWQLEYGYFDFGKPKVQRDRSFPAGNHTLYLGGNPLTIPASAITTPSLCGEIFVIYKADSGNISLHLGLYMAWVPDKKIQ